MTRGLRRGAAAVVALAISDPKRFAGLPDVSAFASIKGE